MRTICYCLTILLGVALLAPANHANNCGHIEAKSITLKSDDGKHSLTIQSHDTGVGLWVRNEEKKTYAYLYSGKVHGPNISLGNEKGADPIALCLDDAGSPWIQIAADKQFNAIEADTLLEVGKNKAKPKDKVKVKSFRRRGGCKPAANSCQPCQPVANAVAATANVIAAPVRILGNCAGGCCGGACR